LDERSVGAESIVMLSRSEAASYNNLYYSSTKAKTTT
jgi:hypothetical protein